MCVAAASGDAVGASCAVGAAVASGDAVGVRTHGRGGGVRVRGVGAGCARGDGAVSAGSAGCLTGTASCGSGGSSGVSSWARR